MRNMCSGISAGNQTRERKGGAKKMGKKYTAVIQAGGKGTRMRELTGDRIPKPMLLLNGKPLLQWQIESAAGWGIREFIIITGHLGDRIQEYFGDGTGLGVRIFYIEEKSPLGSAGSLYELKDWPGTDDFLLIYGDVMSELDLARMLAFHESHMGQATLLMHPNQHPYDSDLLTVDADGRVTGLLPKGRKREGWYENCVNAGIYIFSKEVVEQMEGPGWRDLEKDVLTPLMKKGEVYGYRTPEYVKDVGTPERFRKAALEQKAGMWERKCLRQKQRCIFLIQEGVIGRFRGLLKEDGDFELEELAGRAVRRINESGFLAIALAGRSVDSTEKTHRKVQTLLGRQGAYLDDTVFLIPHPGCEISCQYGKTHTEMIDGMAARYHIDLRKSYMIGGSIADIQMGTHGGMRTVLAGTGLTGTDEEYPYHKRPDLQAENLLQAVELILEENVFCERGEE